MENILRHKELAIQMAKNGAIEAFLAHVRVVPVILTLNGESRLQSHVIESDSNDSARNKIVSILQGNNIDTYIFIGSGEVRASKNIIENVGDKFEQMLIVAYVENGGAVEQYVCPVKAIIEAKDKNIIEDIQWYKRKIFSIGNIIIREW
tara:strand:+ start:289 stop:735 length:447 start_codon:yes stop_codon:yes gene_type:complete